ERPDNTGSCFGHDSRRLRRYHTEVVGASVAPHSAPRKDGTMGWQRIRGHDALVEGFRRVVQRGRLAHAYLFVGPPGVGRRLFATGLARALLCEKPTAALTACDECPSCVQIDAQTHPDFYPAARPADAHEFPIELMRELCANFSLKSARGRGKVILI